MMAGAGVGGVGGAGMLRTRRRDVSVKPNRKLDRKSSRGMIYENEELRLRTIHINAEVEQGQNDIKKLRRENEQLRREIWSLRDEYDKLEEILKRQKNHDESEEYEDRSEEDDDGPESDFSCEEDEEGEREARGKAEDFNQEERLENAENQKISSEKMSGGGGMHRLHVEFDDLSVVDEEEEPRRDKERKEEASPPEEGRLRNGAGDRHHPPPPILSPRQLHDNIPFYPAAYEPTSGFAAGTSYYTECPYEFPNVLDLMLPAETTSALLASPGAGLPTDPLIGLDAGLDAGLNQLSDPTQIHAPPLGWQSDALLTPSRLPAYASPRPDHPRTIATSETSVPFDPFDLLRRNAGQRDATVIRDSRTQFSSSEEAIGGNVWGADSIDGRNATTDGGQDAEDSRVENQNGEKIAAPDKPRHFFAPLPSKLKKQEEDSPTASVSHFGTGTSSSSGKTASTVISRTNPFWGQKGSADIYVNGAIPCEGGNTSRDEDDSRTSLSTNNLLLADSRNGSSNQLMKSVSCQDLSCESQGAAQQLKLNHVDLQMLARSDNTLDNIMNGTAGKPYKSHLNVTLKTPRVEQAPSPDTPEVPNLPSIDYRLFRNPFLRNFDKICPGYRAQPGPVAATTATTPLSIQVNDDVGFAYQYPAPTYAGRGNVHRNERPRAAHLPDSSRLLMPNDQLTSNKQDIQVTSFEKPSPCTLIPSAAPPYDLTTLRRLNANRYLQSQNLYQNVPFVPRGPGQFYPQRGGMTYYDSVAATKVSAQTQTSLDGDSHHEDERQDEEAAGAPNSPAGQRQRRTARKDKGPLIKEPLSPAAQRRLRKQSSVTSTETLESPGKATRKRPRRLSAADAAQDDKNESRSSSSGQDSPRKDQNRRGSVYVNAKRRSSQTSLKTTRSGSVDKCADGVASNAERERTNSVSSRETAVAKARKTSSTSSGSVPWCACWGNGCI